MYTNMMRASGKTAPRFLRRRVLAGSQRYFRLERDFVAQFKGKSPNFGFNGLGELVYYRTYARVKENGIKESWYETVERVVNGVFSMQERWLRQNGLEPEEADTKVTFVPPVLSECCIVALTALGHRSLRKRCTEESLR